LDGQVIAFHDLALRKKPPDVNPEAVSFHGLNRLSGRALVMLSVKKVENGGRILKWLKVEGC
jgi:hypothetical protein